MTQPLADQTIARLSVDRRELQEALHTLARFTTPRTAEEVVITFEGDLLRMDCGGVTAKAAAAGSWPGRARVRWRSFRPAAASLPPGDPVVVCVAGSRLFVQRFSVPCEWLPEVTVAGQLPLILLPLGPSPLEVLALRYRFAEPDIAQSGHLPILEAAERDLETQIDSAWRLLAHAGVSRSQLRAVVEKSLKREAAKHQDRCH
jgi:hypothetical protein